MKGLTRCDYTKSKGWYCRIYLINKKIISKFFSDRLNQGKIKAEEKAKAWLNLFTEIYKNELPHLIYRKIIQKNNKSGIVGVHESFDKKKRKNKIYYYPYIATTWQDGRSRRMKRFYIHKYSSKEDAIWAAYQFRKKKEQELDEKNI